MVYVFTVFPQMLMSVPGVQTTVILLMLHVLTLMDHTYARVILDTLAMVSIAQVNKQYMWTLNKLCVCINHVSYDNDTINTC